ncbi:hypothetical protein M9Y10_043757 [Tritrichomonas musculus]|uniref:TNFR-Cys domain-containing protein n=1 Tax=Tritrichomonas musculus TaxID=1915356 RepID=A0ABR2K0J3_9EUKA
MFLTFFIFPIFLQANTSSSNDGSTSDVWFITDNRKKIICDISISSVSVNSKVLYCNNTNIPLENIDGHIFGNQYEIKIKGSSFSNGISVNNTLVNIILDNIKITSPSSFIIDASTVYLFILGDSNSIVSSNDAGIQCSDSFLQIMNATSQDKIKNSLTVSSDKYAGIGGGSSNPNCKGIFIYGGRLIANGGEYGAGIGGGEGSDKANSAGVNKIEILNGDITATGGKYGAGIGGGSGKSESSSKIDSIKISGGKVQAIGGEFSAGIGGGYGISKSSSNVGSIEIIGGEVSAKGGNYGSGIGNGYSSNHEASLVFSITLDTNMIIQNSVDKNAICTTIDATKGQNAKKAIGIGYLSEVQPPSIIEKGSTISCQSDNLICSFSLSDKKCIKPWKCSSNDIENCPKCNVENCDQTNVYCFCEICKEGFTLNNGLCESKSDTTNPDSNSTSCQNSIENCIEFLNDNCHICDKCRPGFSPSKDRSMCVSCAAEDTHCRSYKMQCQCETCDSGFSPDPQNNYKCKPCEILNCAVCNGSDFSLCQQCASGYVKNGENKCEKCSFSEDQKSTEYSCIKFQPNTCTCEKCQLGYFSENGKCYKCQVPNCYECSTGKDRCTSCSSGYKITSQNNNNTNRDGLNGLNGFVVDGEKCEPCNVKNCIAYSVGCSCSSCSSGFVAQNGVCVQSSLPIVTPIPDQNKKIIGIAFCAASQSICNDLQNGWTSQHKQKLFEFITSKLNDIQTSTPMKYGYKMMLKSVNSIESIHSADSNSIISILKGLSNSFNSKEIAVLQFGSMLNQFYDFNAVPIDNAIINIFAVNGYSSEFTSYDIPKVSINGGNLKKVQSIACFFGSLNFNSLIELNQLSMVASTINDNIISIRTNVLLIDSHSVGLTNKMKINTKSFGIIVPETTTSSYSITLTIENNQFSVSTTSNSVAFPISIGKEQTMIITSIKNLIIKLDPLLSKKFDKLTNISFKNDDTTAGQNIFVDFYVQSQWTKVNFKKGIIFEHEIPNEISFPNKPLNFKIRVNKRDKDGNIIYNNDSNNNSNNQNKDGNADKKRKPSGLSDSTIKAIIISFICASSFLILSIFLFFRNKPKVKNNANTVKDSSTPLLHQVFNDGF